MNKIHVDSKLRIDSGKQTPGNISQKSIFKPTSSKAKQAFPPQPVNPGSSSFHFMGGFLTRPKEKSGYSKLEKEINKVIDSLKHMRKEISTLKNKGTKISVHETIQTGPTKVTLSQSKHILHNSRSTSPNHESSHHEFKDSNEKSINKKLGTSQSGLLPKLESKVEGLTKYQGIVKNLLGQLVNNSSSTKDTTLSVDEFVKFLMPKERENPVEKSVINHNASVGDLPQDNYAKKTGSLLSELTHYLVELAAAPKHQEKISTVKLESKGVQTEESPGSTINFSNINLSKTIEELIKKVIVESPSVKYNPNNLTEYFEKLVLSDRKAHRSISDMQKQSLFVSIYSLLQRQLLVEVTLEMIKDSGVNVQNLFQYTFSRMGLDYDKYVQFENNRDQDLSARAIFEGDLDCSLDNEKISERNMVLNRFTSAGNFNYFPLDFNKIQQTVTQEQTTEKSEVVDSTKR